MKPFRAARRILDRTAQRIEKELRGPSEALRVHVVCYEDVDAWILGKFASRLAENLSRLGVEVDISKQADLRADINHHIIYYDYDGKKTTTDTVMVTHIDSDVKLQQITKQLAVAKMGVCMSRDTVDKLGARGVPRNRLCFVNPASDGIMKPRRIVLGIASKVQPSGCKREQMLVDLASHVSPDDFEFHIMGAGWERIVDLLRDNDFTIDYVDRFDRERYRAMMPELDYYLYFGEDEGSMGFVDALAAGVPTIVTPQGYHLDAVGGITHAFSTSQQLIDVLTKISTERRARVQSVAGWTWLEYARKHLALWRWLLRRTKPVSMDDAMLADLRAMAIDPRADVGD
jgi:hypothetical protein